MIITIAIIIVRDNNSNNNKRERENKIYKYSNSPIEDALTVFEGYSMCLLRYIKLLLYHIILC